MSLVTLGIVVVLGRRINLTIFNLRSDISRDGSGLTPLHVASQKSRTSSIARFIISLERDRLNENERRVAEVPSYNMRCNDGWTPVFGTVLAMLVEDLLQFDDLEVTRDDLDDLDELPLLWRCAEKGIVSRRVAMDAKLRGQFGQKFWGTLPLEEGRCILLTCVMEQFREPHK